MKIVEEQRDLFEVNAKVTGQLYCLAHCISADFGIFGGIVIGFNERWNMKNELLSANGDQTVDISDDSSISVSDTVASSSNDYEDLLSEENVLETITAVSESIDSDLWRGIWEEYIYSLIFGEKLNQMYFANKYNMSQAQISRKLKIFKDDFVRKLTK